MAETLEGVIGLQCPTENVGSVSHGIENINLIIDHYGDHDKCLNFIIVGKYTTGIDTYLSVHRAIEHAAYFKEKGVKITYVDSDNLDEAKQEISFVADAVIIPGGFGSRGTEGMIEIAKLCRSSRIPMLGICLGMQIMCIESARHILGNNCISTESIPNKGDVNDYYHIVAPMYDLEWKNMGGTMRLGSYTTTINDEKSIAYKTYKKNVFKERHRHRYEINPKYIFAIEDNGMVFSGTNQEIGCVDIVEDPKHPFYVGCQYHPEFQSSNDCPSPLFVSLVESIDK